MKNSILSILFILITGPLLYAQSPAAFNYQGLLRTADGDIATNTNLEVLIAITDGDQGEILYSERHLASTDGSGVFTLKIGQGTPETGTSLTAIAWGAASPVMQVSIDAGEGMVEYTNAALISVPYAMHAVQADSAILDRVDDADADPTNELQTITMERDTIFLSKGGGKVPLNPNIEVFSGKFEDLTGVPEDLADGDDNTQLTAEELDAMASELGFIKDAGDTDPTNEIQDLELVGTQLRITNNANRTIIDMTPFLRDTDTRLTESQVVAFVENNGYLKIDSDGTDGQVLKTDGNGTVVWADDAGLPENEDIIVNGLTVGRGGSNVVSNTAVGDGALEDNTSGQLNVAIGAGALDENSTGFGNSAIGQDALGGNNGGILNTAVGYIALSTNTTGNRNTAIGVDADVASSNLENATAIGFSASVATSNTIQLGNDDITDVKTAGKITTGAITLPNTDGTGGQVLKTNGSGSVTWADDAGLPENEDIIVHGLTIGRGAGNRESNVAFGVDVMESNTTGSSNVAIGFEAFNLNTSGFNNVAIGDYSLSGNTEGYSNTATGSGSLLANTTGINNVAIGPNSLFVNTTGSFNTAIGSNASVNSVDLENTTAIGYNARVSTSNTIQLGNTNITDVITAGKITTGAITLPNTDGTGGQVLTTDGSGAVDWADAGGMPDGTTAGEMMYWNGTAWVAVAPTVNEGASLQMIGGVPTWTGGTLPPPPSVTSPTGKTWMDRNLGATQVATSSTDAAAYGDLYQWGRGADGHQIRTSATTTTLSSSDTPGHDSFVLVSSSPFDWRSPQNDNLWQGVNGVNNPCPSGYRLPTNAELDAERLSWGSKNGAGAFASPLKLPMAGIRVGGNGSLINAGIAGYYWSGTVSGTNSRNLLITSDDTFMSISFRMFGYSVRCIKD